MGEETDGVVESVSKMQEKIKGLTGVDILTDSGAYKDTYTILYEIGQVWNDLENLDRSALLELMAGKNRANTLAAILNNMEDLEGAYKAALNADGSALKENLTYLDSIDGKIKLVTNSIQTMWMHFLDSNVLKFLLDVANGLIKIADKAGLIGSSLAIFSGYRATKKDSFISSIFDENLENKLKDKLTGLFNRKSTDDLGNAMDEVGDKINDNVINLNEYKKSADGAKVSTDGLKGSVQQQGNTSQVSSGQNRANEQSIRGVGIASIFAKGAVMAFKMAASALTSALIGMAVQKAIEFFYNLAHAEEQAADRATDAISTYRSTIKELKDQKITTDELAAAYERLSSGVNTATNTNIGLTVEAYGEYIDVCNQIADIYPELITGYDAQGNAIINLKDNVKALTDAYEEAEKAAASQFLTASNKKDIWNTYENTVTKDNFWNTKASLSEAQEFFDIVSKFTDEQIQELQDAYYNGYNGKGLTSGMDRYLTDMFGIDVKTLSGDKLSALESQYDLDFSNMTDDIDAFRRKIGVALSDVNSKISSALGGIKQSVAAGLIWDSNYQQLDKNMQSIMDSIVNNLDMDMISQMGANSIDDIISGLLNGIDDADKKVVGSIFDIQDKIAEAMSNGNQTDFDAATAEFKTLVAEWIGEDGEIIINPDADVATQYLQRLAQSIGEQSKNFEVKLQFKEEYESSLGALQPETSGETYQDKQQEAKEIVSHYENIMAEANELGIDTNKTVFGNIDTNNRQVLQWTKENAELYKNAIESWGESVDDYLGAYSTVDGKSMNIDGIEIAFSPMLQTDSGAVYLDKNTVDTYFSGLFEGLGKDWSTEDLLALDAEGLEVNGQHIKGLIADIGDTAIETGAAMHFTGNTGAIVDGWSQIEVAAAAAGISAERYVQAVKNGDWNALGIDIPEAPPVLTASELLDGTDAKTYIENARKMSKESGVLAEAQNAMITALAGEDGVLYSDEMTEMYDAWAKAGNKVPEGADWTDDQIAGIQILDELINQYNTDIDTVKQSLIELGLIAPSLADIGVFDFKSESTQELISKFESDIASIKETWNSLNDGEMTKSDFIEWAMEFPEAIEGVDLSSDNWMVQAKENAEKLYKTVFDGEDGFITSLTKQREAMAAQGKDTTEVDKWIAYATQIQSMPLLDAVQDKTVPNTISNLEAAYENYKTILEETNEVLYDGQKVSEDYYESLKEYIDDVEALDSCFDKNNKQIVTNAQKLKMLITQQEKQTESTIKMAKSQAQLQYKNTIQAITLLIKKMQGQYNANKYVSQATLKTMSVLKSQLAVLRQTIQQYTLLELKLTDAAKAYKEFEDAKSRDAELSYGDSMIEMIQALNEGFKTGKVGTEAFQAAVKALVPESVYADIDDLEQRMIAIHDYVDKNPIFADYFTIDDGEFSIEFKNIEAFVQDGLDGVEGNIPVFIGSLEDFDLSKEITSLKEFADALGITEAAALGMLSELEKYDARWGDILTDLTSTPLDRNINEATRALEDAVLAQEEFIRGGGDLNSQEYIDLKNHVYEAAEALDVATEAAKNNALVHAQIETIYAGITGEIKLTESAANNLADALGLVNENGNCTITVNDDGTISLTAQQMEQLADKKNSLSETTYMDVQLQYDDIVSQIEEIQGYLNGAFANAQDSDILMSMDITNIEEARAKLNELTATKQTIECVWNISTTSTEQQTGTIEQLEDWSVNGVTFKVKADTTEAQTNINALNENEIEDKDFNVSADNSDAIEALEEVDNYKLDTKTVGLVTNGIDDALSDLRTINNLLNSISGVKRIDVDINTTGLSALNSAVGSLGGLKGPVNLQNSILPKVDGTAHIGGTANADGNWGAPKTETSLVGELGPEILVRNGRWTTIGKNGAEFTQVKKGDIIFNHKQTEQLLKNGYVTGRGKAYAEGTAYRSGITDVYVGENDVFKDGSDEWMDPWENESDGITDAAEEFAECIDGIAIKLEELEEAIGLLSAELENAADYSSKNSKINEIIGKTQEKYATSLAGAAYYETHAAKYLGQLTSYYQQLAQYGEITIKDFADDIASGAITEKEASKIVENVNSYREYAQKAADLKQQAEEAITEIRDLAIQRIENAYEHGKLRADIEDSQNEKYQNIIDLHEEQGRVTSDRYYEEMMKNTNEKIDHLRDARDAMQAEFNKAVQNGELIKGSNEWYEQLNELYSIDAEIAEATIELEEFQNAINDIYWDNFENLTNQLEYLKDQTQSLIDLMEHSGDLIVEPEKRKHEGGTEEYWTAEDVKWTNEGLAALGLYAQQMEIAEFEAKQYAEAIDDLNKAYADKKYSDSEYLEKLEELTSAQYDSIEAYYEAQDAIINLNKTRIDSIKNGIEKEIDAYTELIEKKKEELNAEKDLYDFQKSTMQQQKNIAEIERKLAALANDNSLSAASKRKQLEAELAEAQYELQDTYYNRSVEDKQTALDKELQDFQEEKNAELVKWEEYLTNVEVIVADSLNTIQANASIIYDTLNSKAQEYDLTLSDSILSPWRDGELAVSDYQNTFDTAMSSTMNQLDALKRKWQDVIDEMARAADIKIPEINAENSSYESANQQTSIRDTAPSTPVTRPPVNVDNTPSTDYGPDNSSSNITVGGKINAGNALIYATSSGTGGSTQYFKNDPIYTVVQEQNGFLLVRHHTASSGYTGWFRKSDVTAYAKGTVSAPQSGLVNIDELGEELIIRAKNGRLSYMEKGSGVVPADLTSNLMKWGKLDPKSMIEQNRPSIAAPIVQNKEINLDITYGDILHIEQFNGDDPDEIAKIVAKQFEKHTKQLNSAIRKFAR